MTELNSTINAVGTMGIGNIVGWGWTITIIVFVVTIGMLYIFSKNFRQFLYGSIFTAGGLLIYSFSRWIGKSTAIEHNYIPIKWFGYIIGFIIISIIIGKIIQKLPFIKKFEKDLELENKHNRRLKK